MKRRRLTYDEWECILDKKQNIKYIDNENCSGYVSKIDILNVSAPQIWRFNGEDIIVCRNGYSWISILPKEDYYCITAMLNEENHILLWYIDMIANQGVDADSIPYFDDLYLDLVVYPNGDIIEDDRDELEQALSLGDITLQQFELANITSKKLKNNLLSDINKLKKFTADCEKWLIS